MVSRDTTKAMARLRNGGSLQNTKTKSPTAGKFKKKVLEGMDKLKVKKVP